LIPHIRSNFRLKHGTIRKVWEHVKDHLQTRNTDLHRFVNTWQMLDGSDEALDNLDPDEWNIDMFPVFRLELEGGDAQWFNEVTQKTNISYKVVLGVEGYNQGDATDYWQAVIDRMYVGDLSFYHKIKQLGVMSYSINLMGVTRRRFGESQGQLVVGRFILNHELRTKY
jgi:hypothetical protein